MKTTQTIRKTHHNYSRLYKVIWITGAIGIGFGSAINPALAEESTVAKQYSNAEPVKKPNDGKGNFPTFAQADKNGDHYVTKDELQNFPYLLQVFDKVDAGHNGKLEQHEYQNLEMETKREGEIR
jgi:hypothetical protein